MNVLFKLIEFAFTALAHIGSFLASVAGLVKDLVNAILTIPSMTASRYFGDKADYNLSQKEKAALQADRPNGNTVAFKPSGIGTDPEKTDSSS